MGKILTICATRERVDKCARMIDSFYETSTESALFLYVDSDDNELSSYVRLLDATKNKGLQYFVGSRMSTTRIINGAFKNYRNYDYYHISNDDFVYKTKGWDTTSIEKLESVGGGVVHYNDGYIGDGLVIAPFVSGCIVRALGWLQLPGLNHLFGDNVWKVLGDLIGSRHYLEDVHIEHHHPYSKDHKVEPDDTFKASNSNMSEDQKVFRDWLKNESYDDSQNIKKLLDNLKVGV